MNTRGLIARAVFPLTFAYGACGGDSTAPDSKPVAIAIVNPDFEIVHKAGSTTVTASALTNAQALIGTSSQSLTGPSVTFSDNSTGTAFSLDGWVFSGEMGIANVDAQFTLAHKNVVWFNGALFGGGTGAKSMTQVLATSSEKGRSYVLTADFGWRNDNAAATSPAVLNLYAGSTLLTPDSSTTPELVKGGFVTFTRYYTVAKSATPAAFKVEIGLGANTDGRQLNVDHVTLTKR